jgi:hypothetical protein
MINITPESKRAGWRLDKIIHNRLVEITKEFNVSLEEAGNIILGVADEYEVEQALKVLTICRCQQIQLPGALFCLYIQILKIFGNVIFIGHPLATPTDFFCRNRKG